MKSKRNIWEWLAIITAILCIVGAMTLTIAYGFTVGNAITFILAAILIALGLWMRKLPRWMRRTIFAGIAAGIIFFLAITSIVIAHGANDEVDFKEDAILVLGCGIRGETVLPTLQSRLDRCLDYLEKNPETIVLVSGGQGHNEDISEAEAMKRYLLRHGIPEEQIIKEDRSRNTTQNLTYSKTILDSLFLPDDFTVAVVTSDYHAYRVSLAASDAGLNIHSYSAGVKWYLRPSAYSREALSVCKFWVSR